MRDERVLTTRRRWQPQTTTRRRDETRRDDARDDARERLGRASTRAGVSAQARAARKRARAREGVERENGRRRGDDDDDDERDGGAQRTTKGVGARLADDADESEDESEDEGEGSASWQPSLLRRLQSVSVNGGAMAAMVPKEEAEEKARAHVRSVSAILPYDLLENASSYEEVLEDWRRKAETACEYVDEEDEGFERYYVPRHEVRRHLVDAFVVDDCGGEGAGGECVDGHVQFSPDMTANAEQTTSAEKKTRVLDRGESFTFGDVPAVDADDGLETPIPQGWVDSERDAASNALEAFHLKVFHQAQKNWLPRLERFRRETRRCGGK